MAAPHPTSDRCLKAAVPYLALDFFSLSSLDPQEVGESCSKGAWVQLSSSLWGLGSCDLGADGHAGQSARPLLEGSAG